MRLWKLYSRGMRITHYFGHYILCRYIYWVFRQWLWSWPRSINIAGDSPIKQPFIITSSHQPPANTAQPWSAKLIFWSSPRRKWSSGDYYLETWRELYWIFTEFIFFILSIKTLFALQSTFQQDGGAQPPVPILGAAAGQGESCYNVRYI